MGTSDEMSLTIGCSPEFYFDFFRQVGISLVRFPKPSQTPVVLGDV